MEAGTATLSHKWLNI